MASFKWCAICWFNFIIYIGSTDVDAHDTDFNFEQLKGVVFKG